MTERDEITALARGVVYRYLPDIDYSAEPRTVQNDLGWALATVLHHAMKPLSDRLAELETEVELLKRGRS